MLWTLALLQRYRLQKHRGVNVKIVLIVNGMQKRESEIHKQGSSRFVNIASNGTYDQIHKIVTWRVAMNEKRLRIRRHCVHCTIDDRAETSSIPKGRRTGNRGVNNSNHPHQPHDHSASILRPFRIDLTTIPHRKSQSNRGIVHGHCLHHDYCRHQKQPRLPAVPQKSTGISYHLDNQFSLPI